MQDFSSMKKFIVRKRERDSQRSKVYASEHALDKYSPKYAVIQSGKAISMEEVRKYIYPITHSRWWKSKCAITEIDLRDDRRSRRGHATLDMWGNCGKINLPKFARYEVYILHELAHILTDYTYWRAEDKIISGMHGQQFVSVMLDLVKRFMGVREYEELKESYKKHKVKFRKVKYKKIEISKVKLYSYNCPQCKKFWKSTKSRYQTRCTCGQPIKLVGGKLVSSKKKVA